MILNEISPFIIVDGLSNEFSKSNFIHFLSKPSSLILPDLSRNWKSKIYTSKTILELSSCYLKMNIEKSNFHQLVPNERTRIEIPSKGEFFMVTLLETQCSSGKILLLFENSNGKRILYPGEFTFINNLSLEVNLLISKVDVLYLDNTLACNNETISTVKAFSRIEQVVKNFPKHNFILNIPNLGCEELLIRLTKKFKIHFNKARESLFLKLNVPINQASIADGAENCLGFACKDFLNKTLRIFKEEKIIFIRFKPCLDPKFDTVENTGVYYVNWSPHPTFNYLFAFVLQVRPKRIVSIHSQFPEIPEIIQELCEVDENYENGHCVELSSDESFGSFEEENSDDSDNSSVPLASFKVKKMSSTISLSSSDSNETVIFNPSQNTHTPVAQSTPILTPIDRSSNILLKRKQNVLENCKKKLSRNFPQAKILENRGVNYLD